MTEITTPIDATATEWNCEACGSSGRITHDEHADIMAVVHQLTDAHMALALRCHAWNGYDRMRVRHPESTVAPREARDDAR